jgi:hypothetical protein
MMRRFVGFGIGHTVSTTTECMPLPILIYSKYSTPSFEDNAAGSHKHIGIRWVISSFQVRPFVADLPEGLDLFSFLSGCIPDKIKNYIE